MALTPFTFLDATNNPRDAQADLVSGNYVPSIGVADPLTGNRAQVSSPTDNETISASTSGMLVRTVAKLKNLLGTGFDTVVNAGIDLISPRGVQTVSAMLAKEFLATSTTSISPAVSSISLNVANTSGFVAGAPINLEPGTVNYESALISSVVANTSVSITFPTGGALFAHTQPFTVQTFQENMPRQAPGGTGVALVSSDGTKKTYRYSITGFTPVATPTDFLVIQGSATMTGRIKSIKVGGKAATAGQLAVQLIRRSTAGTLGSATLVAITPAMQHDINDAAPTMTVSYVQTANYSVLGTSAGQGGIKRAYLNSIATGPSTDALWEFAKLEDKAVIMRGVSDFLCFNGHADALPATTVLDIEIETEEDQS